MSVLPYVSVVVSLPNFANLEAKCEDSIGFGTFVKTKVPWNSLDGRSKAEGSYQIT